LPSCLDDYVSEDNPARVIDAFVEELDLRELGFAVTPAATGRPAYHPATLLKLYVYGYLNWVPSSRRLEREAEMEERHGRGHYGGIGHRQVGVPGARGRC
jgi:transposase